MRTIRVTMGLAVLAGLLWAATAAADPTGVAVQDPIGTARELWQPGEEFLRDWLCCGAFPMLAGDQGRLFRSLDHDYLAEHGGEATIVPAEGLAHTLADGSKLTWQTFKTQEDVVRGSRRIRQAGVGYFCTTIHSESGGPALLAVGCRPAARIFLNGQCVRERSNRGFSVDAHLIQVDLRVGDNLLMVKMQQYRPQYDVSARIFQGAAAVAMMQQRVVPELLPPTDGQGADKLRVRCDLPWWTQLSAAPPVTVELVAPGGTVVASAQGSRGQVVTLDTGGLAEGPYEIRVRTADFDGRRVLAHLGWYKGDFRPLAIELLAAGDSADRDTPAGMIRTLLAQSVRFELGGPPEQADPADWHLAHAELMEYRELGEGPGIAPARAGGFVRLAWHDDVDDSPQFCRVYLPLDYTPDKPWPMVVCLHGHSGTNPPYHEFGVGSRHSDEADRHGIIFVEPHGRGNSSYVGIGERDVLRCIEMVSIYNVDADRVYLFGESMGGGGTWYLATRHPELFAAIGPVYGGWDYRQWVDRQGYEKMTPREQFNEERHSSFVQMESLLNVPVFLNAGEFDRHNEGIRIATTWLQTWGYPVQYWEHPRRGHYDLGYRDRLIEWFLTHRRVRWPREVRVRAAELRSARAHWVRVEQSDDPYQMMEVRARIVGPNMIDLATQNVLAVTLSPGGELVDPAAPLTITWNGREIQQAMKDGALTLQTPDYQPQGRVKTPECAGTLREVTAGPHAIVVGTTSPDPMVRRLCRLMADRMIAEWEDWQHVRPRVIDDTALDEAAMGRYSLLLIGGPADNAVSARLTEQMGVDVTAAGVRIAGVPFDGPDLGVAVVRPHPLRDDAHVQMLAGTSALGMLAAMRGAPGDLDYCVMDAHLPLPGRPMEDACVASGVFDWSWRLREDLMRRGDPGVRARSAVDALPQHLEVPAQPVVYLGDVLERLIGEGLAVRNGIALGGPLKVGDQEFPRGLGVATDEDGAFVRYDLPPGQYTRLRATVSVQMQPSDPSATTKPAAGGVTVVVEGDGEELQRSANLAADAKPVPIDLDITGVRVLRLGVTNRSAIPASANWADLRLERQSP